MKRKSKDSKLNIVLSALLVLFVCLLTFSIGVITGKGWSDRDHQSQFIESDTHLKAAMEDNEPLGDEMTDKEVELLTKKALEEAKAQQPEPTSSLEDTNMGSKVSIEERKPASSKTLASKDGEGEEEGESGEEGDSEEGGDPEVSQSPLGREASQAKQMKVAQERAVSSLMPKPSTPKPTSIEYTVQVAAYKTMGEAEIHSQKLIDKGFPAFPVMALIGGKTWYRVSIGSFKNRKQAMKYEKALKKQAVVTSTFVQKIHRLKK